MTSPQAAGGTSGAPAGPVGDVATPPTGLTRSRAGRLADGVYLGVTVFAALVGVAAVAWLVLKMAGLTSATWDQIGIRHFLTGREWVPATGQFGALPAIYGTIATSAIAMAIAVPLAVGVAIGTVVILPKWMRGPVTILVDLLAAIPSVVFGLWGFLVLVPAVKPVLEWVAAHNPGIGALDGPVLGGSILLAGLVLAVMILPIMTAVIREVIAGVPGDQAEAALALGATRWETVRSAVLPMARSGIVGAAALGLGRAVGETIAVMMIIGGQPNTFSSLLGSGQSLAGTIASEYNSAVSSLHTSALISMGLVLFLIAFIVNVVARVLVSRTTGQGPVRRVMGRSSAAVARVTRRVSAVVLPSRLTAVSATPDMRAGLPRVSGTRRLRSALGEASVRIAVVVALVPLVLVIGYCIVRGAGGLSWDFFTSDGEPDMAGNGIRHALTGTAIMVAVAVVVSVPLGVLTALFMRESASRGPGMRRASAFLGAFTDMLLGVPSIVAGLVIAVAVVLPMGVFSALAGGLALAFIMYPIVVRSSDEMLRLVPAAQVEAALALGAPRWRVTWSVVLPHALPGILTGVMIAVARVAGETAPLLVTALGAQFFSRSLFEPIASLPAYIFTGTINSTVPVAQAHSWAAALVLVGFVLVLNLAARTVVWRMRRENR